MITLANIRRAIYCLNKRIDLLEQNGISGGGTGGGSSSQDYSEIRGRIEALESIISEGSNPTAAIDKFNEIVNFLDSINNTDTLQGLLGDIIQSIPTNTVSYSNDNGEGIIPSDGIMAETVTSAAAMTISPDVVTVINGAVGTATITLQVPQDNLAHVWDILMTTDSTVAITFAMSNSATILYPNGFSVGASKAIEISVIGVGTKYYLRYGEFA